VNDFHFFNITVFGGLLKRFVLNGSKYLKYLQGKTSTRPAYWGILLRLIHTQAAQAQNENAIRPYDLRRKTLHGNTILFFKMLK